MSANRRRVIAIAGAGFSGLMTLYALVRQARIPFDIELFDPSPYAGQGIAFSTECPMHLLNVPCDRMGALHDDSEHFYKWLQHEPQRWRKLDPSFERLKVERHAFIPRMIYGSYLQDLTSQMEEAAAQKQIHISWNVDAIEDAHPTPSGNLQLITSTGRRLEANILVLALAVPWTNKISRIHHKAYLETPWPQLTQMNQANALIKNLPDSATIGLIGSGLTMLDVLATLKTVSFSGNIVIISRRGYLSQTHQKTTKSAVPNIDEFPRSALGLLKKTRKDCQDRDWREVIDSIRPITPMLWQRLPTIEQKKFLRHLLSVWNTVRHRAPPEALELVSYFKDQGHLQHIQSTVTSITPADDNRLDIHTKAEMVRADLVVNCTGPDFRIAKHPSLLIQNLLKNNLVEPDPLGLGFRVEAKEALISKLPNRLFAIGTLLFGTYFETIAVPELRRQCHSVATDILTHLESK